MVRSLSDYLEPPKAMKEHLAHPPLTKISALRHFMTVDCNAAVSRYDK